MFYNITGSTWAKSSAAADNTSEVFGVIESTTGLTATVVTQGSVNIPDTMLHDMGSNGGSGGNDIWFLSGITSGHMQNLAPTAVGNIVKPVYYAYPHEFNGATFSGLVVNYIGYSVSSVTSSTTTTTTTAVGAVGSIFASPIAMPGNTISSGWSQTTSLINLYINRQIVYNPTLLTDPISNVQGAFTAQSSNLLNNGELDRADLVSITDPKYTTLVTSLGSKAFNPSSVSSQQNLGYLHYIPFTSLGGFTPNQATLLSMNGTNIGMVLIVDVVNTRVLVYMFKDVGNISANTELSMINLNGTVLGPWEIPTPIRRTTAVGFRLPNYGDTPLWHMKLE